MPFRIGLRTAFASLSAVLWLVFPASVPGQSLIAEKDFFATDNTVEAIEVVGDSVYVGGHFTHVGRYTGPLAPVSIATGATLPAFPEANDLIFGLASDGTGGWFVGGDFTEIGGVARNHVAHILPDLSVDPIWNANVSHRVHGFAIHGSTVYMHGFFSTVGGQSRFRLAAVTLATGTVTKWDPNPTGGGVTDFFLDGDTLYVSGSFSGIAGESRNLAAFDLTTGDLTPFDPVITNNVEAVAVRGGAVYVGGLFTTVGGSTRNRLAAFDATTSALLPWDPNVLGTVRALALSDSTIWAGGAFGFVGGALHQSLVELDLTTGAAVPSPIAGTTGQVFDLLVHQGHLYLGGDFTDLDSEDRRFLGGFDLATGALLDTPSPIDQVNALAASGDTLFVGGEFGAVSGVIRNRFAAFHASTLELLPMAPDFQNIVWDIKANSTSDTLYVSGRFITVNGLAREKLASFDLAGGALTDFNPTASGDVYQIVVTDSLLYLGGNYSTVNGSPRSNLASVDRVVGNVTPWNPGSNGFVTTISAWNDTLYVGGSFSTLGDSSRTNVGAVNGTTGEVLGWGSAISVGATDEVDSFLPFDHPSYPNGGMFIGGDFLNMGIGLRRGVAALHRNTGNTLYPWNPFLGPSFETKVHEFALADGLLYIAGDFDGVLSNDSKGAAAIDVVTGQANRWVVNAGKPRAIAVSDSMVFLGGAMAVIQGYHHSNLAAFRRDTDPPLPASALTATPGTTDKRIDLTWSASASIDIKDYLVYRTASAGADTTGRQIGVAATTGYVDIAPDYGEWFYRVFARDEAHNVGPASNEDSAEAPNFFLPPKVTTAIHQNPALSRYANVIVVSDSLLIQLPTVSILSPAGAAGADVPMVIVPGAASSYQGAYEFTTSGAYSIQTSVVTATGPFDFERDFSATLLRPETGGTARSVTGLATLDVPANALRDATYVVMEESSPGDGDRTVRIGPAIFLEREATLEFAYDPERFPNPEQLVIARLDGTGPTPIPSEVFPERGVVRARIHRLGKFGLVQDVGGNNGHATPVRLALHQNHPNPFGRTTDLRYDLPRDGLVRVTVYDVTGQRIADLHHGVETAGRHAVSWNGRNEHGTRVAAGVYFARVTAHGSRRTIKMVLLR